MQAVQRCAGHHFRLVQLAPNVFQARAPTTIRIAVRAALCTSPLLLLVQSSKSINLSAGVCNYPYLSGKSLLALALRGANLTREAAFCKRGC